MATYLPYLRKLLCPIADTSEVQILASAQSTSQPDFLVVIVVVVIRLKVCSMPMFHGTKRQEPS